MSGGFLILLYKIVIELLNCMDRRISHACLGNLADRGKWDAAFARHLTLRDALGAQFLHHGVVKFERCVHGRKAYSHLWLNAIAAHGFYFR